MIKDLNLDNNFDILDVNELSFNYVNKNGIDKAIKRYGKTAIDKLKKVSGNLLSDSGDLILKATSYRSQNRNKDDALKRLIKLFKKASEVQKKRIKTRPSLSVKRKRLDSKRKRSEKKELRKSPKTYD